ncbi:hypothetical protein [Bacillus sp. ISL-7]|uniref:hypothetical protein n=1 Tax=Bacillus sp. ISL-7 TaxID=2819136 RepID=UPI001BE7DB2F|nr:hypothetical protein [Bacillus sp. ISL-7]MBT2736097.1 hypothetical protein [Bacillus sp. ISL-7]
MLSFASPPISNSLTYIITIVIIKSIFKENYTTYLPLSWYLMIPSASPEGVIPNGKKSRRHGGWNCQSSYNDNLDRAKELMDKAFNGMFKF